MNPGKTSEIGQLLDFFPEVPLPIVLSEDLAVTFSAKNKPIPAALIAKTIAQWEPLDEYTEIVPCFLIPINEKCDAIIYWVGSLMTYEYIVITIQEKQKLVNKKVIAGTISNGQTIKKSVAHIDEDFNIRCVVGESKVGDKYSPDHSKSFGFEILPDGQIMTSDEENNIWQQEIKKTK
jgi:hypothetical protein